MNSILSIFYPLSSSGQTEEMLAVGWEEAGLHKYIETGMTKSTVIEKDPGHTKQARVVHYPPHRISFSCSN